MVSFPIRTPDYRLRVFVSSTLGELSDERAAVRSAIEQLHLAPVMFELGARPHPPRSLYRAYLDQSHVFVGIYWQRYGWVAPGESISGLEDEYRLAGDRPRLLYIKQPAPEREERLADLTKEFQADDRASYKRFATVDELSALVVSDLALLLSERFEATLESSTRPVPFWTAPPLPLTETVGREAELKLITSTLGSSHRLITLTGPGGVGKTRLAQEIGRRLEPAYSEGIYFVPLETVTEDKLLERSIVDRLGIPVEGAWSAREALVAYFSGRRALLILDNVEQIVNVERPLRELLERIPGITLLVTSRRSLGIAGAHEIDVSPLPTPEPSTPKGTLAALPAVRLFLDRARDVGARFETEDDALQAVAEICRRVDGLPLAIELAAARTRLLPPTSLLSRLNEGLDLLHRRAPDVPERQQTLRATLAWSYKLLEEQPRALLARLSVFAGSFSLEAAEQVCDPNGSMEFVDSLTSLLDNSLVLAAEDPSFSEPRFRMLETVRTFAAEQLDQTPEADVAFRGHLAWYRELSHQAHPFLCGPNQKDWAVRMDAERANVRKAVTTALNLGDLAGIVELAWDLAVFYEIRDASQEPGEWLREVIERNPDFDDLMRAKLVSLDALFRAQAGDFTGAADSLNWSLSEFRRHGLDFYCAVTLMVLAGVYYSQDGDTPRAVEALQESINLFHSVEHDWGVARTEIMLATMLWSRGDEAGAEDALERSLTHSRLIENEPQIARALALRSMLTRGRGANQEPMKFLSEAGEIVARGQYRTEAMFCLSACAGLLLDGGEADEAANAASVAQNVRQELGLVLDPVIEQFLSQVSNGAATSPAQAQGPASVFTYLSQVLERTSHLPPSA